MSRQAGNTFTLLLRAVADAARHKYVCTQDTFFWHQYKSVPVPESYTTSQYDTYRDTEETMRYHSYRDTDKTLTMYVVVIQQHIEDATSILITKAYEIQINFMLAYK